MDKFNSGKYNRITFILVVIGGLSWEYYYNIVWHHMPDSSYRWKWYIDGHLNWIFFLAIPLICGIIIKRVFYLQYIQELETKIESQKKAQFDRRQILEKTKNEFYYRTNSNEEFGPFSHYEIKSLLNSKKINLRTFIRSGDQKDYSQLSKFSFISKGFIEFM